MKAAFVSLSMTIGVIANALYRKKQFFPAMVYISKSSSSLTVIYGQLFVLSFYLFNFLQWLLFGTLSRAEQELLTETAWISLSETLVAFAVFRARFTAYYMGLFGLLLASKCFHFLVGKRVEEVERNPFLPMVFHGRLVLTLTFLELLDFICFNYAYSTLSSSGMSINIIFGFEYLVMMNFLTVSECKYMLNMIEKCNIISLESKSIVLLYIEIVQGTVNTSLLIGLGCGMAYLSYWPLFAFRRIMLSLRDLKMSINSAVMWRRAARLLDSCEATQSEIEIAELCLVCRETLGIGCTKLNCGHIFHTGCLRAWFRRQQSCPTCRLDVLANNRVHGVSLLTSVYNNLSTNAQYLLHRILVGRSPHRAQEDTNENSGLPWESSSSDDSEESFSELSVHSESSFSADFYDYRRDFFLGEEYNDNNTNINSVTNKVESIKYQNNEICHEPLIDENFQHQVDNVVYVAPKLTTDIIPRSSTSLEEREGMDNVFRGENKEEDDKKTSCSSGI